MGVPVWARAEDHGDSSSGGISPHREPDSQLGAQRATPSVLAARHRCHEDSRGIKSIIPSLCSTRASCGPGTCLWWLLVPNTCSLLRSSLKRKLVLDRMSSSNGKKLDQNISPLLPPCRLWASSLHSPWAPLLPCLPQP